jgi:hypothetical protein
MRSSTFCEAVRDPTTCDAVMRLDVVVEFFGKRFSRTGISPAFLTFSTFATWVTAGWTCAVAVALLGRAILRHGGAACAAGTGLQWIACTSTGLLRGAGLPYSERAHFGAAVFSTKQIDHFSTNQNDHSFLSSFLQAVCTCLSVRVYRNVYLCVSLLQSLHLVRRPRCAHMCAQMCACSPRFVYDKSFNKEPSPPVFLHRTAVFCQITSRWIPRICLTPPSSPIVMYTSPATHAS